LIYFNKLLKLYIKNFLVTTFSLISFFVFIDFMFNKNKLPDSLNLEFLYIIYQAGNAFIMIYPLTLFFALIITISNLIKNNELVSFLSLGFSIKRLYFPFFIASIFITIFMIFFQTTSYSLFLDSINKIKNRDFSNHTNKNLFFKFKNRVIYIKEIDVYNKKAYGIEFFKLDNHKIKEVYFVKEAIFKNNRWYPKNSIILKEIKKNSIITKKFNTPFLENFKPTILNKLETKSTLTLKEAIEVLYFLKHQDININFIKVYIYSAVIVPFSFILLMSIIFFNTPIHSRISNVGLYIAFSLITALLLWALFLLFKKIALNGILSPDILFLTPFLILLGLSIYYYRKI